MYTQCPPPAQKKDVPTAFSILDESSQSESLQRKADMADNAAQRTEAPRPNNTGMPDNLKSGIESLSGFSMDDVRVHYNSSKPATVQALAYTQGTDIHVAPGQEKHLPHEAWHVAQQMAGRVSPTTNINGMAVNDNAGLEHEADVMGEKAVQCKTIGLHITNGKEQHSTVQKMAYAKENEDGTVSAETEQYEGNEQLINLFGRTVDENGNYKRPDNVARKVDQYKKEMLTYIASCIQERGEKNNRDYGPHISVVITRGIWFIAINTDSVSNDNVEQLRKDAVDVQGQIKTMWDTLSVKFPSNTEELKADASGNVSDDLAKKQALYIVYRWAGKDNGVVVEQNLVRAKTSGVVHGEMATINFLKENSNMFNQAKMLFEKAKGVMEQTNSNFKIVVAATAAARAAGEAAKKAAAAEEAEKNNTADKTEKKTAANTAATHASTIASAAAETAKTLPNDRFENARKYVKTACGIVNDCSPNVDKNNRAVRVGGTKTPCFDCGYEMNLHNEKGAQNASNVHTNVHRALNIGPRNAVTMTSNFGSGFPNWIFGDKSVKSSQNTPESLKHDPRQNQDYNELYDTFNSLKLNKEGEGPVRMEITDPMKSDWFKRMVSYEKDSKSLEILDELKSLDKAQSLQLKNLIVRHLETLYNKQNTQYQMNEILPDELQGYTIFKKFFNTNHDLKKIINFERLVVRRLDLNIQGFLAKDNSSTLEIDKEKLSNSINNLTNGRTSLHDAYTSLLPVFDTLTQNEKRKIKGFNNVQIELNNVQTELNNVQTELSNEKCNLPTLFSSLMAQDSALSKNNRILLNMTTFLASKNTATPNLATANENLATANVNLTTANKFLKEQILPYFAVKNNEWHPQNRLKKTGVILAGIAGIAGLFFLGRSLLGLL